MTRSRVSPAGDGDFYFGGGDVPGDRVEVVHRWHVLQLVHNVSLHLHGQILRWCGSDPGSAQPGSDRARWVSGDSGDQIRDQLASGASGWGSHLTNVEAGQNGGRLGSGWTAAEARRRTWLTVHGAREMSEPGQDVQMLLRPRRPAARVESWAPLRSPLCARSRTWEEKKATYSQTHPSSSHSESHSRAGNPAHAPHPAPPMPLPPVSSFCAGITMCEALILFNILGILGLSAGKSSLASKRMTNLSEVL